MDKDNLITKNVPKWYFYSDSEPTLIAKWDKILSERISVGSDDNSICIETHFGSRLYNYFINNKNIKLFAKRVTSNITDSGENITIIEKFCCSKFDLTYYSDVATCGSYELVLHNPTKLSERKVLKDEFYEFW